MKVTAKVLAVKRVDFENDDGEQIIGRQLWVCAPTEEPAWNGYEVMKIWVADSANDAADCAALIHGDTVEIDFNRRGKPYVANYTPNLSA